NHIEHGREDEAEARHAQHAEEYSGAEGLAHFRARATSQHQRHNPKNESETRHKDRPQTEAGGFDRGVGDAFSRFLGLFRELDDENRVLAGKTDEDDETDLRE